MAAKIVDLADAVVTAFNGQTFSQSATATRTYEPETELQATDTLTVQVVMTGSAAGRESRAHNRWDNELQIGVFKRPATFDKPSLDALILYVEEIAVWALGLNLTSLTPPQRCVSVEIDPLYSPDHLYEMRQFTSVLRLGFLMVR